MSGLIRTVFWILLCGVLAGAAVLLELDRQSRTTASLAASVPEPARSFAQAHLVAQAIGDEQADAAFARAARLVRHRPVPSEHLGMLAIAAQMQGNTALADRAVLLSAERGWRFAITQQAIAIAAAANGEPATAADRLLALWRSGAPRDLVRLPTQQVLAVPEARSAFARGLGHEYRSRSDFLDWGVEDVAPDAYSATVAEAVRAGAPFDCTELSKAAERLVRAGEGGSAARVWSGPCAAGTSGSPDRWAFPPDVPDGPAGPFDWRFPGSAGLDMSLRKAGGTVLIDYTHRDGVSVALARKFAALSPGRHALRIVTDGPRNATEKARVFGWCIGSQGARVPLVKAAAAIEFTVPAQGCAVQLFEVRVRRSQATGLRLMGSDPSP